VLAPALAMRFSIPAERRVRAGDEDPSRNKNLVRILKQPYIIVAPPPGIGLLIRALFEKSGRQIRSFRKKQIALVLAKPFR